MADPFEQSYDPARAGRRVAALRSSAGFTKKAFGLSCRVSPGYITEFERGERVNARRVTLEAFARALGWPDWSSLYESDELSPPAAEAETEIAAPEVRGWLRGVHASAAALIPLYPDAAKLVLQLADDPESPFGHSPPPWSRTIVNVNTSAAAALSLAA